MQVDDRAIETLTPESVERLRRGSPTPVRAQTAASVAALFAGGNLSETERQYAVEILDALTRDAERQVREAVSAHVKHCPYLPASIARALAEDVESVALPIIRYSAVLAESDLILLVRDGSPAKRLAVAGRPVVSATVADALVETRDKRVVGALLQNKGADIAEPSYRKVLDHFDGDEAIQALLVARSDLPIGIVERLITCVSEALREALVAQHRLPPELVVSLTAHGRERALARAIDTVETLQEAERLARYLHRSGSLTPTLMLRFLCRGELTLFAGCVATLAGVPAANAHTLILDRGEGFRSLYEKAELPFELFLVFRVALERVREIRGASDKGWSLDDTQCIVRDLVMAYDNLSPGHLETVLAQLARLVAARPRRSPPVGSRQRPVPWDPNLSAATST